LASKKQNTLYQGKRTSFTRVNERLKTQKILRLPE
jgi:hypothetical protein